MQYVAYIRCIYLHTFSIPHAQAAKMQYSMAFRMLATLSIQNYIIIDIRQANISRMVYKVMVLHIQTEIAK